MKNLQTMEWNSSIKTKVQGSSCKHFLQTNMKLIDHIHTSIDTCIKHHNNYEGWTCSWSTWSCSWKKIWAYLLWRTCYKMPLSSSSSSLDSLNQILPVHPRRRVRWNCTISIRRLRIPGRIWTPSSWNMTCFSSPWSVFAFLCFLLSGVSKRRAGVVSFMTCRMSI